MRQRPLLITVLSCLAMLNGAVILALGVLTLAGNDFIHTTTGYGDDRVAISSLFGPLAQQAGWVLLCLGPLMLAVGYGLFSLKEWARRVLAVVLALAALATVAIIVIYLGHWGVTVSGVFKVALYTALLWYLHTPSVRWAFAPGHR